MSYRRAEVQFFPVNNLFIIIYLQSTLAQNPNLFAQNQVPRRGEEGKKSFPLHAIEFCEALSFHHSNIKLSY